LRYIKKITYSWYCSASPAAAVVDAADVVGVAAVGAGGGGGGGSGSGGDQHLLLQLLLRCNNLLQHLLQ